VTCTEEEGAADKEGTLRRWIWIKWVRWRHRREEWMLKWGRALWEDVCWRPYATGSSSVV
jgi:hypothetical protein